jgi:hypothetical protein
MPNPPSEVVPPDPVEITQPERQIDPDVVDPMPSSPNPVAPTDVPPVPANQLLED